MTTTFSQQFMNIAILLVLAQANFEYIPVLNKFKIFDSIEGQMVDFSKLWYASTGSLIVKSLLFNMFTPQIELIS